MRKSILFIAFAFVFFAAGAQNNSITGFWKIQDIKAREGQGREEVVTTNQNCYFCDLYRAGYALVFNEDGTVSYENNTNPTKVNYELKGGNLLLTAQPAENTGAEGKSKAELSVTFKVSIASNQMTLVYTSGNRTEVYTFTK